MKSNDTNLAKFIYGDRTLVIPVYQRNYDWKVANCVKLFDDMKKAVEKNSSHFIGAIVYQDQAVDDIFQEFVIIDGQQRIASVILFARALYEIADDALKNDLNAKFLRHTFGDMKNKFRLRPTEYDGEVFAKIMDGETNFTDDEKKSALYKNFHFFRTELAKSELSANELYKALYKLNVVSICLSDNENPQEIFESLNSTGLDLTQADLIRNFLLMPLASEQQEKLYKNYWLKIEEFLRPSDNVENFIVQYMITKRKSNSVAEEHLSKQKLYAPFKDFFAENFGNNRVEDFLRELLRYAEFFRRCIFDDTTDFSKLPALDKKFYELTFLLNAKNAPIILMYLLDRHEQNHFDEETFIKFVDVLISLAFRAKVCKHNGIDQQFAGNVLSRLEKNLSDVDSFWEAVTFGKGDRAFPSDKNFQATLASNELHERLSKKDCKYFLYATERQTNAENLPAYSETVVEEILPSNPNAAWKNYLSMRNDSQAPELWSKNLGNLTLALKNEGGTKNLFDDKKIRYAQSKFSCTRAAANHSDWTSKQIQARAKKLSAAALNIWTLPEKFNKLVHERENILTLDSNFGALTFKKPATLSIFGTEIKMPYWNHMLREIVRQLYALDKDIFRRATQQDNVRKNLFRTTPTDFQIDEEFYMATGFDTKDCLKFAKILAENFDALGGTNFKDDIWFTLRPEAT